VEKHWEWHHCIKVCAVACTVNVGFPSIVTQLWNENEVGKFATLAIWKHCDATVSQTTCRRWLLETQAMQHFRAGVRYIRTWLYCYAAGMVLRVMFERERWCLERLCWENHSC